MRGKKLSTKLVFAEPEDITLPEAYWRVLIVDDVVDVFEVTKLALQKYPFLDRIIHFEFAPSARKAIEFLENEDNIAVLILDIITETDYAGFQVIDYIRNVKKDRDIQIIIRSVAQTKTDENGEKILGNFTNVALKYDVQACVDKALTRDEIRTLIVCAIRQYAKAKNII